IALSKSLLRGKWLKPRAATWQTFRASGRASSMLRARASPSRSCRSPFVSATIPPVRLPRRKLSVEHEGPHLAKFVVDVAAGESRAVSLCGRNKTKIPPPVSLLGLNLQFQRRAYYAQQASRYVMPALSAAVVIHFRTDTAAVSAMASGSQQKHDERNQIAGSLSVSAPISFGNVLDRCRLSLNLA